VPFNESVAEAVGNTPLIKLRRVSEETGCTILGKAEFMNPGQSVKDRAALFIIKDAIRRGQLRPGGTIVEGTAGNTGIGLTVLANAMGFKSVIVIPETQSQEKKDTLRLLGAELVEVPAVPYKNPNNYVKYSARLAETLAQRLPNGVIWANQFDNVANRQAHVETTAEEIWTDTGGSIDGFICAVGSGGTLGGVSLGLKAKNTDIVIGLADPPGAALYSYYTTGKLSSEGSSITEGIGQGRITANLEGVTVDRAYRIEDKQAVEMVFSLLSDEGFCLGASSGVNVAGAKRLAEDMGTGHTIVTVLCDLGYRYQSRLFNPTYLKSKNLPVPAWLERTGSDIPEVFAPQPS
jgi:cysteine synthase A